jgi:hypothetical protein
MIYTRRKKNDEKYLSWKRKDMILTIMVIFIAGLIWIYFG